MARIWLRSRAIWARRSSSSPSGGCATMPAASCARRAIRAEGLSIEVNSGGEISKALAAGFTPGQMVFNGVAKSVAELERAIILGIKAINVDSPFELSRIAGIAAGLGQHANVSLR